MRHIEPGGVQQLERSHTEAGPAFAQQIVDAGKTGDAFRHDPHAFGIEAAPGMIDQKTGRVLGAHRLVTGAPGDDTKRIGGSS